MSVWGGLIVADMLALVDTIGAPGVTEGDLQLAETLGPVAAVYGINTADTDARLIEAMRRYGHPVDATTRCAIVRVGESAGLSAGPSGVIECDGQVLVLAPWDLDGRHDRRGWLPIGVRAIGKGW